MIKKQYRNNGVSLIKYVRDNIKKAHNTYLERRWQGLELSENKYIIEAMVLVSLNRSGICKYIWSGIIK
jgi:hypothetical protein